MASITYNVGKVRLADGTVNYALNSGRGPSFSEPDGNIRVAILIHDPTVNAGQGEVDQNPDNATVAACFAQGTYEEYDGAGYPGPSGGSTIAARPKIPLITVTQDNNNDEADLNTPGGTNGEVAFGSPAPAGSGKVIRGLLIYDHQSDTNDALNIPLAFIDQGTLIGQNGNTQPMTVSWSGVFASLQDI